MSTVLTVKALRFYDSTIGKKAVKAVPGLILCGFPITSMLGNLQIFIGQAAMNRPKRGRATQSAASMGRRDRPAGFGAVAYLGVDPSGRDPQLRAAYTLHEQNRAADWYGVPDNDVDRTADRRVRHPAFAAFHDRHDWEETFCSNENEYHCLLRTG
jgi:hypothetical protein